jgi:serine/threonine protein kinase
MSKNTIGKYEIIEELGRGSMGVVYKGRDPNINRLVAIKTIKKELLDVYGRDLLLTRLKREAQAAGSLSHPNIVVVYDYGEDHDTAYIAMAFVEGKDLKCFFDDNEVLSEERVVDIMSELLDALSHAHKHNIIHRDIKPANIIVMPDGHIKVTDFGIARIESSELTMTGTAMGTPNYMSPEQCHGQTIDGRADIFSAGVILYQFLTREKPFDGHSYPSIMHKILNVDSVPPSKLNPMISREFDAIVAKALAKRPEDRYQTADEFNIAIQNAISVTPAGKSESHGPHPSTLPVANLMEETKVISQIGQKPSPIMPSLQETVAARTKGENDEVQEKVTESSVSKIPSQEATIAIPKKSQASTPPKSKEQREIVRSAKQAGRTYRVIGISVALLFITSLWLYWVWHSRPATPTDAKTGAVIAEKAPIAQDKESVAKPSVKIDSGKISMESSTADNSPQPISGIPSTQNNEPAKETIMVTDKVNSVEPPRAQPSQSKKAPPSPACRSLMESYQLGDPSITPQRIKQACEQ